MFQQRSVMLTVFKQWVTHPVHLCVNITSGNLPLVLSGVDGTTWCCVDLRLLLVCNLCGFVLCGIVVFARVIASGRCRVMHASSHVEWLVPVQSSCSSALTLCADCTAWWYVEGAAVPLCLFPGLVYELLCTTAHTMDTNHCTICGGSACAAVGQLHLAWGFY